MTRAAPLLTCALGLLLWPVALVVAFTGCPKRANHDSIAPLRVHAGSVGIATLGPGQALSVHFQSVGCFASVDSEVVFRRENAGRIAAQVTVHSGGPPAPTLTRTLSLNAVDAAALDRELAYRRPADDTVCSSTKTFESVLVDGDLEVSRTQFSDDSCTYHSELFTFSQLIVRAESGRPDGAGHGP